MRRRVLRTIGLLMAGIIIGLLCTLCINVAGAQEVTQGQTGTFTSAPGATMVSPNPIHPFRVPGSVGTVVTFPVIGGLPVDWAALRAGRLSEIADSAADKIHFGFDSADLTERSTAAIVELVGLLQENPDVNVAVEGHTDTTGEPAYNLALSLRRADAVRGALADAGLDVGRINTVAHGEGTLFLKRALVSERNQNRRVEFHLIDGFTGAMIN